MKYLSVGSVLQSKGAIFTSTIFLYRQTSPSLLYDAQSLPLLELYCQFAIFFFFRCFLLRLLLFPGVLSVGIRFFSIPPLIYVAFLRFTIETHKQYTVITHSLFLFEFLIYLHRLHRTWCFHFDWFCCHLHNFFLSCNHNNRSPVNLPHVVCSWNHTRQAYNNRNQAKLVMTVTWSGIQHQLR